MIHPHHRSGISTSLRPSRSFRYTSLRPETASVNDGEAFGIDLEEVDKTKLLISRINDRHIFPHIKISYMMRSVDSNAEHFVLAVKVAPADSVIRYREGDDNETVFIKGDGRN